MITVAFRFDDPSPTSDHGLEKQVIRLFAKHDAVATFAVIPFGNSPAGLLPLTAEKAAHLIDAAERGVGEIALHGYTHERRSSTPDGSPSEMAGLGEREQTELVRGGMEHLCTIFGSPVRGFVPPWNTYDATTMRVVEQLGFHFLSAGWGVRSGYRGKVGIVPRTAQLSDLRLAIAEARRFWRLAPVIIVVLHHYDFAETGDAKATTTLEQFDDLLAWVKLQDGVEVQSLARIAERTSAEQCLRALRQHDLKGRLPWRVQAVLPKYCIVARPLWRVLFELCLPRVRVFV